MNQALISMTTRYHYAPKGERISADMEKKSCNYSYIRAIDYLRFIGSVKQEDFFGFLCLLLQKVEDNTSATNFVFFMDNARTHHSKNICKNTLVRLYNSFTTRHTLLN